MSISSELALETAARTFGDIGNLFTLENGALFVAGFNVVMNSVMFLTFLLVTIAGIFGDGNLGCSASTGCLRIPPPEAIFIGGLGAVLSGGIVYLNVRLYSAVQEKDDEFVWLWLKISSGLTLLKGLISPNAGYIVPDVLELWLVHAFQQSQEIVKLKRLKMTADPKV